MFPYCTASGGSSQTGRGVVKARGAKCVRIDPMITLNDARRIIAAAEKKAAEIGQPMNIAVVDEGANLIAHVRMDGAYIGSIDISINNAYTSRAFDIATKKDRKSTR